MTTDAQALKLDILAMTEEIGRGAWISVRVGGVYDNAAVVASVYPIGLGGKAFQVLTNDFESIVPAIRDAWKTKQNDSATNGTLEMAGEMFKRKAQGLGNPREEFDKIFGEHAVNRCFEGAIRMLNTVNSLSGENITDPT